MKPAGAPPHAPFSSGEFTLPALAEPAVAGPFIVALEGANGAGKSTLCQRLARRLDASACMGTDAAWLAESFKVPMIRDAEWFVSALFFLSGCLEQMRRLQSSPSGLLIMDRSLWSTLAVHAAEDPERLATLLAMLRPVASRIQVPHLTLVLDADYATCQGRISRKAGVDRLLDDLTGHAAFHARERAFYQWLALQRPEVRWLDATPSDPEAVADQAVACIQSCLAARGLEVPSERGSVPAGGLARGGGLC